MTTARVGGMGKARWADLFRLSSVACRRSRSLSAAAVDVTSRYLRETLMPVLT